MPKEEEEEEEPRL